MVIRLATCVRERAITTQRSVGLRASLLALGLVGFVECAAAANLLTNADFDQADGLSAWSWFQGQTGTLTPCSGDANCGIFSYAAADECCGRANSGSVAATSPLFYDEFLEQCVAVPAAETAYDYGAWLRLTTASGFEPGLPYVSVVWYASLDCSGASIGNAGFASSASNEWTRVAIPGAVAPATTRSAVFEIIAGPFGDSGTAVGMEIDSAFFGPAGTVPVDLQSFAVE